MQGYDLALILEVTRRVRIPVIASGGAGNYHHFLQAVREAGASAVAAASIYHFTEQTPLEAKKYLAAGGVMVRDVHRL
jgi:cyclase